MRRVKHFEVVRATVPCFPLPDHTAPNAIRMIIIRTILKAEVRPLFEIALRTESA